MVFTVSYVLQVFDGGKKVVTSASLHLGIVKRALCSEHAFALGI